MFLTHPSHRQFVSDVDIRAAKCRPYSSSIGRGRRSILSEQRRVIGLVNGQIGDRGFLGQVTVAVSASTGCERVNGVSPIEEEQLSVERRLNELPPSPFLTHQHETQANHLPKLPARATRETGSNTGRRA